MNYHDLEDLRSIIDSLAVKYDNGDNRRHGQKVARLALSIFDQLARDRSFSRQERLLLEYGALLHDIGAYINDHRHPAHSSYIILNDSLTEGFDPALRVHLAIIADSHRRSLSHHLHDQSSQEQEKLRQLIALLRIADALDYDRQEELEILELLQINNCLQLRLSCSLSPRAEIKLRKKSSLFQEQFKMTLECLQQDCC